MKITIKKTRRILKKPTRVVLHPAFPSSEKPAVFELVLSNDGLHLMSPSACLNTGTVRQLVPPTNDLTSVRPGEAFDDSCQGGGGCTSPFIPPHKAPPEGRFQTQKGAGATTQLQSMRDELALKSIAEVGTLV